MPRARDLGLAPGIFPPGPRNAITDVEGVRVGQVTIIAGEATRTGVLRTPDCRAGAATILDWPNERLSPLFVTAAEATEEAVLNALTMPTTVESRIGGKRVVGRALPLGRLVPLLARRRG